MRNFLRLSVDRLDTPVGELIMAVDAVGMLRAVDWSGYEERMLRLLRLQYAEKQVLLEQRQNPFGLTDLIRLYFEGELWRINQIPVATGGTSFQRKVWEELRNIPAGSTISYGQLAQRIARPKAVRAVGLANGSNPIGVVVPCHRVIGANGSLTGYGGGLERKRWLLEHERQFTTRSGDGLSARLHG